jgi:hypothetical protein
MNTLAGAHDAALQMIDTVYARTRPAARSRILVHVSDNLDRGP